MSSPVVFVSAVRTAIGRFRGALKDVHTADLGSTVARAALERAGIDGSAIDEVYLSDTYRADLPGCSARPIGLRAGVPIEVPGHNLNMHCGTGLKAIVSAAQAIRCGDAHSALVVAMESMSRAAFLLRGARNGYPLGHAVIVDQLVQKGDPAKDPAIDPTAAMSMGETAEELASRYAVSREDQDAWAVRSHARAIAAQDAGRFDAQIVPVEVPGGKKGPTTFAVDEHPRRDTTLESLARLKPVFRAGGTVTAGNSSGMNDAAAALVLMSEDRARELGLEPLGRLVGHAAVGVPPEIMGIGPVPATKRLLDRTGRRLDDFSLIELNEAFAAQILACLRDYPELAAREDAINVNGSGISLGHPIGATGAILAVKALHELRRTGGGLGLLTMCIGGGQGIAVAIES
ncbi:MAG: thiolase family protein [Acidobacteria bacterium]|nr:thiolase family protein [Acidobacteriota bacterium]